MVFMVILIGLSLSDDDFRQGILILIEPSLSDLSRPLNPPLRSVAGSSRPERSVRR